MYTKSEWTMYDKELIEEAVLLSYIRNDVDKVAADIGIDSALLHSWRQKYGATDIIRIFEKSNLGADDLKSQNKILRALLKNAEFEHEELLKIMDHNF
jgi:transposase-like protein